MRLKLACAVAVVIAAFASGSSAQTPSSLAGQWTIDRAHSEFPAEIGFEASFMPDLPAQQQGGGGGRGRSRNGGGRTNPAASRPDSADDGRRILLLTDAVRTPPVNIVINDAGSTVTITTDGLSRTFHPNGQEESIALDQVSVPTVTTRVGANLVVLYHAAEGRDIRYTYWRAENSPQLTIDAAFVERGATDSIRRVYVPGTAEMAKPAAVAPSAASTSKSLPEPPPAAGPGAEFKGLAKIGVVVEELTKQAAACGLTHDAIESVVKKSVAAHGTTVADEASPDSYTYIYVNVMTTSTASGLCVSRYDVSLLTSAAARLPYQDSTARVQVQLAHSGSLAGGDPKTHADAVMHGVSDYVDEIAGRIQSAK
jgi:hypothetical protein